MSEDDRAAKAARAKAMLNRRRQQKAGAPLTTAESSSSPVSQIPSRTHSPAPSEQPNSDKSRDPAELFSRVDSDASWISSMPRAMSPSARLAHETSPRQIGVKMTNGKELGHTSPLSPHRVQSSPLDSELLKDTESKHRELETRLRAELSQSQQRIAQLEQEQRSLESLLDNERQTVTLLVSEKSNLAAEVIRLEAIESQDRHFEASLVNVQKRSRDLEAQLVQVQSDHKAASGKLQSLETREKELNEKRREQERQLQLANGSVAELRSDLEGSQRRVKELEEQISSDDRVERLEESLKNTQDRADELQFLSSKLRQSHATLKNEYVELEELYGSILGAQSNWDQKNADLQEQCSRTAQDLSQVTSERDGLVSEKTSLQTQVAKAEHSIQELRKMLEQASSEISIQTRQLHTLQSDLRAATKRADEAERIQKELQLEGTNLMRSLDEMRPKIVDLTSEKLNSMEKVESLQHALQDREAAIDELKSSLEDARSEVKQINDQWQQKWAQHDREQGQALAASTDMQKAYTDLQDQLSDALQSMRNLESQRASQHQELVRNAEEIERVRATNATQREELATLGRELELQSSIQDQQGDFLDQARNEIEMLQSQLQVKEEECERLQSGLASDGPRSLNDEFLDSLRQQHALDLSAAQSQIRALEDSVFGAEAKAHALQKQVVYLEDQLRHGRSGRPYSPIPSRPASRNEEDLRRSPFAPHRTVNLAPSSLSRVFDNDLTPETLYKRKISLSMLKARMEGEMVAQPPSRALSPVLSQEDGTRPGTPTMDEAIHSRPQFLDDSHVFWCSSCRGDLVIL